MEALVIAATDELKTLPDKLTGADSLATSAARVGTIVAKTNIVVETINPNGPFIDPMYPNRWWLKRRKKAFRILPSSLSHPD